MSKTRMDVHDWGRTVSKYRGSYHADYDYHYGDKMISVAGNNFPGEDDVAFEYGGDQKLRERDGDDGSYAWYNWDLGWTMLNEENYNATKGTGTLARTYITADPIQEVGRVLGHFDGTATNSYYHYRQDNIRNTRRLEGAGTATFSYTPYGQVFASTGDDTATTRLFTGHSWGQAEQLYFAPYRFYSPQRSRWMTRDPLGMVDGPSVYGYVHASPTTTFDPLGLLTTHASCLWKLAACKSKCFAIKLGDTISLSVVSSVAEGICDYFEGLLATLCYRAVDWAIDLAKRESRRQFQNCKKNCDRNYDSCVEQINAINIGTCPVPIGPDGKMIWVPCFLPPMPM